MSLIIPDIRLPVFKDHPRQCRKDGPLCQRCRNPSLKSWRLSQTGKEEFDCPFGLPMSGSAKPNMRGLGDVVAAVTSAVGIKPCGGCKRRQEALNGLVPFENKEQQK